MSPSDDLERIRLDVDAELAMVQSGRPPAPTMDEEALTFDPTAADAYEVRLRSLQDSVLAVEESEADLGNA